MNDVYANKQALEGLESRHEFLVTRLEREIGEIRDWIEQTEAWMKNVRVVDNCGASVSLDSHRPIGNRRPHHVWCSFHQDSGTCTCWDAAVPPRVEESGDAGSIPAAATVDVWESRISPGADRELTEAGGHGGVPPESRPKTMTEAVMDEEMREYWKAHQRRSKLARDVLEAASKWKEASDTLNATQSDRSYDLAGNRTADIERAEEEYDQAGGVLYGAIKAYEQSQKGDSECVEEREIPKTADDSECMGGGDDSPYCEPCQRVIDANLIKCPTCGMMVTADHVCKGGAR